MARSGNHIWSASGQPNVTLWHGIAEDSSAWGVEAKLIVACCKQPHVDFQQIHFEPFCIHDSHLGKGVFEKFQPCRRKGLRELRVREWNHISTFVEPVEPYLFNQNCILRRTGTAGTAGTASMPSGWSPSFSGDSGNCPSGRNHMGSLGATLDILAKLSWVFISYPSSCHNILELCFGLKGKRMEHSWTLRERVFACIGLGGSWNRAHVWFSLVTWQILTPKTAKSGTWLWATQPAKS